MFTVSPKQLYREIVHCMSRGLVPLTVSSPGASKSSIHHQIAKDFRLKLIDVRLSQSTPEDLNGFPFRDGDKATFKPFDIFPTEEDKVPEGYDGWLLFLDEFTSATKTVQAAAYKLVLDKMVGSHKLHPQVLIAAAGNKITDRAVVNQISTALQSRVVHYELEVTHRDWEEYALSKGFDHRVTGFMSLYPSKLMDFRPDHHDKTFACPRTWEFVSKLVKGDDIDESSGPRIAGAVGEGMAVEFITYAKEYTKLPKLSQIQAEPENTPIPEELSTKYAAISMLIEHTTEKTLTAFINYVKRFDIELQIIFCRGVVSKLPHVRETHADFGKYLLSMVRYLQ